MKIYDISMTIHPNMPVYKNKEEKKPVLSFISDHSSAGVCESGIQMNMHTGTHVDAPLHMLPGGATVDSFNLSKLVTKCEVLDFTTVTDNITGQDLAGKGVPKGKFILLKTRNSFQEEFDFEFIYLEASGARYLKDMAVTGVGIDALGIERNQSDHITHKILFQAGVVVLEGLRLRDVPEGNYLLCAAPLKIKGAEAAPARALLVKEEYGV